MSLAVRHAAYLGASDAQIERLSPLLLEAGYRIHRAPDAVSVLDRLWSTPCELVIVNHPMTGLRLEDLLATLRDRSSPSRHAGLVLIVPDSEYHATSPLLGRGVNRVVPRSLAHSGLLSAVGDVLDQSPRLPVRAVVQVEARDGDRTVQCLTRTRDVSLTGMLIQGVRELSVGTEFSFELHLPGSDAAIVGSARVIRHTDTQREQVSGVGASFSALQDDSLASLADYLEREAS